MRESETAASEIESEEAIAWICNTMTLTSEDIRIRLQCIADKIRKRKKVGSPKDWGHPDFGVPTKVGLSE